ncbi:MAG TPA: TolC family outer membrane protein [Gammaproteobacteria bacterium]|nr:TolC family outer membrane protein [Gammaproteobacteria bacterium]
MSIEALQNSPGALKQSASRLLVMALAGGALLLTAPMLQADTLGQAFAQAYDSNALIQAQQAQLRASGYDVEKAQAGYKPQISFDAGIGTAHNDLSSPLFHITTYSQNIKSAGLTITQPLYTGGQVSSNVNAAQDVQSAQLATLNTTEEQVFLDVATAYTDVVRDQAVLKLEQNNVDVLNKQLAASQAEFENGEVTRTDVAQSQARLAGAQAALIQAQGALAASRATYVRAVGAEPGNLEQPTMPAPLPATQADVIQLAQQNYTVLAARYTENAAQQQAEAVSSKQKPSVALTGQLLEAQDPEIGFSRIDTRSIMLTLSVPLYAGGALDAEQHAAQQRAAASHDDLLDAQRQAKLDAVNAWQAFQTANAQLAAINSQIQAEQVAASGVRDEASVGERTTLDVLNADQELLNARVNLIRAQRDQLVAAYALKAATGQLTAASLQLHTQMQPIQASAGN